MAVLAQGVSRIVAGDGVRYRIPGLNANVFFAGAFVQLDRSTGLINEAADTANFTGFGIVQRQVTADAVNGTNEVEILAGPFVIKEQLVTGVDNKNDVGDPVYVTDDNTMTLTATANTKPIGVLTRYYASGTKSDVSVFPFYMDQAF